MKFHEKPSPKLVSLNDVRRNPYGKAALKAIESLVHKNPWHVYIQYASHRLSFIKIFEPLVPTEMKKILEEHFALTGKESVYKSGRETLMALLGEHPSKELMYKEFQAMKESGMSIKEQYPLSSAVLHRPIDEEPVAHPLTDDQFAAILLEFGIEEASSKNISSREMGNETVKTMLENMKTSCSKNTKSTSETSEWLARILDIAGGYPKEFQLRVPLEQRSDHMLPTHCQAQDNWTKGQFNTCQIDQADVGSCWLALSKENTSAKKESSLAPGALMSEKDGQFLDVFSKKLKNFAEVTALKLDSPTHEFVSYIELVTYFMGFCERWRKEGFSFNAIASFLRVNQDFLQLAYMIKLIERRYLNLPYYEPKRIFCIDELGAHCYAAEREIENNDFPLNINFVYQYSNSAEIIERKIKRTVFENTKEEINAGKTPSFSKETEKEIEKQLRFIIQGLLLDFSPKEVMEYLQKHMGISLYASKNMMKNHYSKENSFIKKHNGRRGF